MNSKADIVMVSDRTDKETFEDTAHTVASVETHRQRQRGKNKTTRCCQEAGPEVSAQLTGKKQVVNLHMECINS